MESTTGYAFTPVRDSLLPLHRHLLEGANGFECFIRNKQRYKPNFVAAKLYVHLLCNENILIL